MPSTYTNNLGLEKPATGEQAGTWGVTANSSYDFLDMATDGNLIIALSSSSYSLATSQGVPSTGRNKVIEFTGALSADATINITPNTAQKIYYIRNHTTGGFSLVIQQGSGGSFTLQAGHSAIVYADGGGAGAVVKGFTSDLQTDTLLVITSLIVQGSQTFSGAAAFANGVTISPSLALNLGSDAPYDMYYRSAAGGVARLANGAVGQFLEATAAGPVWATINTSIGIGAPIVSAVANRVFFADGSGNLAQDTTFHWGPGQGLGIGVTPAHPLHVGGGLAPEAWFDGPSGTAKRVVCATAGLLRASFGVTNAAESGSNVGGNLFIGTQFDDNSVGWTHLLGFRNTGHTAIGLAVDFGGVLNVANAGSPMAVSAPILILRGAVGQTGDLQQWQNSAAQIMASLDPVGSLTLAGGATVGGSLSVSGAFSPASITTPGNITSQGTILCGNFAAYDSSHIAHNGFSGQVSSPSGPLTVWHGIIVQ
jgi:hypothetical protein